MPVAVMAALQPESFAMLRWWRQQRFCRQQATKAWTAPVLFCFYDLKCIFIAYVYTPPTISLFGAISAQ